MSIKYTEGGLTKYAPLSSNPNELTEYNAAMRHASQTPFASVNMQTSEYLDDLKPTELSDAALFYNKARKAVPPSKDGRKWTLKTVGDLKNECEPKKDLVNKLKSLGENSEAQIFVRLEGLLDGLKAYGELVEGP